MLSLSKIAERPSDESLKRIAFGLQDANNRDSDLFSL